MASAMVFATGVTQGATKMTTGAAGSVSPAIDVLGAHNNYGRGCAGCHAPHSGAYGAGGNGVTGTVTDTYTGTNALFAQDMGPLWGKTFDFSDLSNSTTTSSTGSSLTYVLTAPATGVPTSWTTQQYNDVRGVIMCLACHDGSVARGAMMQNWAYEEQIGALPSSYGSGKIPTLLGNDNTFAEDYNNDHPVGEAANLSAVLGSYYQNAANGLFWTISTGNSITALVAAGQYAQFITSYGTPALSANAGSSVYGTPVNLGGVPYVVCTTCHNQHVMNVYSSSATTPIATNAAGTFATFFFINGPYNLNDTTPHPTTANSTTQFCRQCHFAWSNEANGGTLATSF
jgi:hypothetical protein